MVVPAASRRQRCWQCMSASTVAEIAQQQRGAAAADKRYDARIADMYDNATAYRIASSVGGYINRISAVVAARLCYRLLLGSRLSVG